MLVKQNKNLRHICFILMLADSHQLLNCNRSTLKPSLISVTFPSEASLSPSLCVALHSVESVDSHLFITSAIMSAPVGWFDAPIAVFLTSIVLDFCKSTESDSIFPLKIHHFGFTSSTSGETLSSYDEKKHELEAYLH